MSGYNSLPCQLVHHSFIEKWRLLSALEFPSTRLPLMKSEFAKGFPIFGRQRDELAKRIKFKYNLRNDVVKKKKIYVEKNWILKTKEVILMIIILPNHVNNDGR